MLEEELAPWDTAHNSLLATTQILVHQFSVIRDTVVSQSNTRSVN